MYVLNIKKGSTVNHPELGKLVGGIAYEITEQQAVMVKHIINLVVFDEVKELT